MKKSLREKATRLRKQGWSYSIICERLGVSKSTLSCWLSEVPYTPNAAVRKRIKEGPAKSSALSHQKKLERIAIINTEALSEFGQLTKRDLWMLGLGLYTGEGSKLYNTTQVANSNPDVIRVMMKWFREVCGLTNEHFSLIVHLYPDTDQKTALRFWSKVSGIPLAQFGKTIIDARQNKSRIKYRTLPYGTAHIRIRSRNKKEYGVALHRRILGWINAAYAQTRV